jgi:plastocyanin
MRNRLLSTITKNAVSVFFAVMLLISNSANATTHVVKFGGTFGFSYSPNSLTVAVGDTIEWEGDFSMHPLSSTSVPDGALTFHQASGSVFDYHVLAAGSYQYKCDFHTGLGMTGSFTVTAGTGIVNSQPYIKPHDFRLNQNYPNPFNPTTAIPFDLPVQSRVTIRIYNLIGQEVATIINESIPAGSYTRIWNASHIPSGVYLYQILAEPVKDQNSGLSPFIAVRKLILLK